MFKVIFVKQPVVNEAHGVDNVIVLIEVEPE
jgi:hypothetical protein